MPRIAVAGVSGRVGDALRRYRDAGMKISGLVHKRTPLTDGLEEVIDGFDITNRNAIKEIVGTLAGSGVRTLINCAGHVDLDGAETERYAENPKALSAYQLNTRGAELLAEACAASAANGTPILLLHLSSESVFGDNLQKEKYTEEDEPGIPGDPDGVIDYTDTVRMPTWYGLTKALGELRVLGKYPEGAVVVRMHGVQGPQGGFFARTASDFHRGEPFTRVKDMHVAHLADATVANAIFAIEKAMHETAKRTRGIYHLSARTALTPYEIAMRFADLIGKPRSLVTPILMEELIGASRKTERPLAPRPHYTILGVSKFEKEFYQLPTAEESIDYYMDLYGHLFT